jgi:hypothetical protein
MNQRSCNRATDTNNDKMFIDRKRFELLINRVKNAESELDKVIQERNQLYHEIELLRQDLERQKSIKIDSVQPADQIHDNDEPKLEFTSVYLIKQLHHLISNF